MLVTVTTETYLFSRMSVAFNVIPFLYLTHMNMRSSPQGCFFSSNLSLSLSLSARFVWNATSFFKLACYVAAAWSW